jgi:hypothetical protein
MKSSIFGCIGVLLLIGKTTSAQVMFPTKQPENGNFNRPLSDEVLDISPPGFC